MSLLADAFEGGDIGPERFTHVIGIDGTTEFTPANLSVWIFRELQAFRATATSTNTAVKVKKASTSTSARVRPEEQM